MSNNRLDKSLWKGILVYVDFLGDKIHPVTFELIGKARELADKVNEKVYCLMIGNDLKEKAEELLHYGVDEIHIFDNKELEEFKIEPYTEAFKEFVEKAKPSVIITPATSVGLSVAPTIAAKFKTGLTANCTILNINENGDLVQTRPAFGGNIMADMLTPNHRPQMVTVRYKAMNPAEREETARGEIINHTIENFESKINIIETKLEANEDDLTDAEVIVVAGRGVRSEEDMKMIHELARLLDGQVGVTRPLIEKGWADEKLQIGISGRMVRPKLIITCGISGDVQFSAGIDKSDYIFAINNDKDAPIFDVANYGIVGDLYEVVPRLIENIKREKEL
ncbi:electron transfer flavoprotein subunit alpha/FixB family protein [uncultured Clostridium sp.]|uniref:electron transfer flavoprotein subunit alpha/FixB family protein n=1 Tax=uncultured Clostridium sp. TaxID=59620 RepID=UPI00261B20A3|nr:electron transfer flavoprotein subunit alpha/FixB family protein [uncultured Clostridium sp.]